MNKALFAVPAVLLLSVIPPILVPSRTLILTAFFPIAGLLMSVAAFIWSSSQRERSFTALYPIAFSCYTAFTLIVELVSAFYPSLGFAWYALTEVMLLCVFTFITVFIAVNSRSIEDQEQKP